MVDPNLIEVNEIKDFRTYLLSIEWKDPWLIALVTLHLLTTATAILTRNHGTFQLVLFLILLSLVYFSESVNEYAAVHWRLFSRQQYFDSNGLFISTVFSMPILLNCMLMIGTWLYNSTQIMTKLKVAQLKQRLRQENNAESERLKVD